MRIILNTKELEVDGSNIPYSTLCHMAGLEPFFAPTIIYHTDSGSGTITDGMFLQPEEGMIVNIHQTNFS